MSDFRILPGFEEVWRPPVRPRARRPETVLRPASAQDVQARLRRIVRRAPEVMVKVTGRTRDPARLAAHLAYITRNGGLAAEGPDGLAIEGAREVRELAQDWAAAARMDGRRRRDSPMSLAVILSMPAGVDPIRLRDAARAFAAEEFGDRFDYLMVLHTDQAHPHVHLTVRAQGAAGARLNPKKADLERWRQAFAQALRDRGVVAEATPRRARGVTLKAERGPIRRIRERCDAGLGPRGRVAGEKLRQAAHLAFGERPAPTPWETGTLSRQAKIRRLYLAQARLLQASPEPDERALGVEAERFLREMPSPDTERLKLARDLRALGDRAKDPGGAGGLDRGRTRARLRP